jgi:hypothetical protein
MYNYTLIDVTGDFTETGGFLKHDILLAYKEVIKYRRQTGESSIPFDDINFGNVRQHIHRFEDIFLLGKLTSLERGMLHMLYVAHLRDIQASMTEVMEAFPNEDFEQLIKDNKLCLDAASGPKENNLDEKFKFFTWVNPKPKLAGPPSVLDHLTARRSYLDIGTFRTRPIDRRAIDHLIMYGLVDPQPLPRADFGLGRAGRPISTVAITPIGVRFSELYQETYGQKYRRLAGLSDASEHVLEFPELPPETAQKIKEINDAAAARIALDPSTVARRIPGMYVSKLDDPSHVGKHPHMGSSTPPVQTGQYIPSPDLPKPTYPEYNIHYEEHGDERYYKYWIDEDGISNSTPVRPDDPGLIDFYLQMNAKTKNTPKTDTSTSSQDQPAHTQTSDKPVNIASSSPPSPAPSALPSEPVSSPEVSELPSPSDRPAVESWAPATNVQPAPSDLAPQDPSESDPSPQDQPLPIDLPDQDPSESDHPRHTVHVESAHFDPPIQDHAPTDHSGQDPHNTSDKSPQPLPRTSHSDKSQTQSHQDLFDQFPTHPHRAPSD